MNAELPVERHLDELPVEQCWQLLSQHSVGRVAIAGAPGDAPTVHPVNYAVEAGAVVFSTASRDLLGALGVGAIAFEIDVIDDAHESGWSVLVRGHAAVIDGDPSERPQPWAGDAGWPRVRLDVEQITGRWAHPGEATGERRGYL